MKNEKVIKSAWRKERFFLFLFPFFISLFGVVACEQKLSEPPESQAAVVQPQALIGSKAPLVTPVGPTGFKEVLPYLNAEGSVLNFYDTRDLLAGAETLIANVGQLVATVPSGGQDNELANVAKVLQNGFELSGVESVAAVGSSSVPRNAEFSYHRTYIRYNEGSPITGALWNLFGTKPRKPEMLEILPESTAVALFAFVDFPWLDQALDRFAISIGKQAEFQQWKTSLEKTTGVPWRDLVSGLGDQVGLVITLDPTKTISIPMEAKSVTIPSPAFTLVLKPSNDVILNALTKKLNEAGRKLEQTEGASFISQAVPNPIAADFAPTLVSFDGYLIFGTTQAAAFQLQAVQNGKMGALAKSPELIELTADVPPEGNTFSFVSSRFTSAVETLVDAAIELQTSSQSAPKLSPLMQTYFSKIVPRPSLTTATRNGADWLIVTNGPPGIPMQGITVMSTVPILAAIAIPNFLRARGRGQATTVLNDARALDAAMDQYAIERAASATSQVTFEDLVPYLRPSSRLKSTGGKDIFGRPYIFSTIEAGVKVNPETIQQIRHDVPDSFWDGYR